MGQLSSRQQKDSAYCLYIIDKDDQFSLDILRRINHPNIVHLESFIQVKDACIELCVGRFTETLYYTRSRMGQIMDAGGRPSKKIKDLLR